MEQTTKNKILEAALSMFAERGYKATTLRDLAGELNLSKSALYKHYSSKEAIWHAMIDRMESFYYASRLAGEKNASLPANGEELLKMTMSMIRFTVYNPLIVLSRKLLLTEQFHDERVRKLATRHFVEDTAELFAGVFGAMMEKGILKKEDPQMLAFAYTAPITSLVHLCDREPEQKEKILQRIEAFARYFMAAHGLM